MLRHGMFLALAQMVDATQLEVSCGVLALAHLDAMQIQGFPLHVTCDLRFLSSKEGGIPVYPSTFVSPTSVAGAPGAILSQCFCRVSGSFFCAKGVVAVVYLFLFFWGM